MPAPAPPPRRGAPLGGAGLALVVLTVLGGAIWAISTFRRPPAPPPDPPAAEPTFPLTPLSDSPYLNTGPAARYVGSEACRACHADRHESFRRTGMGRSMAAVDLSREPPDGAFDHAKSKAVYRAAREGGQLWHREVRAAPGRPDVVLEEHPVKYVVGSGRHSLTYLAEADGFLVESPLTWYAAGRGWAMSPGYDVPEPGGFGRAIGVGCLHCHAGRAEAVGASLHRMTVTEAALSCERCHGPGSLHADRHRAPPGPRAGRREPDLTIVNPARLPRDLAESVCRQCHQRTTAVVPARGRALPDFRPGLPFSDVAHAYQLRDAGGPMIVVGHVEQLGLSRCYQKSDRLTCLTCHSPHDEPAPEAKVAYYRLACQTCHVPEHCTVPPARRERESPDNDCAKCHMPRSPTEVPHLAFTHHRIGVHDRPAAPAAGVPELVPAADLSRFSDVDRRRSLGLGYFEAANREHRPDRAGAFRRRAAELLEGVWAAGLRDPAVDVALARMRFDLGAGGVIPLADAALAHPALDAQDHCTALFLKADALAAAGQHAAAAASLRKLVALRRHPTDYLLLADCERALGRGAEATAALAASARIDPRQVRVQRALADDFRAKGDAARAEWHRLRAGP